MCYPGYPNISIPSLSSGMLPQWPGHLSKAIGSTINLTILVGLKPCTFCWFQAFPGSSGINGTSMYKWFAVRVSGRCTGMWRSTSPGVVWGVVWEDRGMEMANVVALGQNYRRWSANCGGLLVSRYQSYPTSHVRQSNELGDATFRYELGIMVLLSKLGAKNNEPNLDKQCLEVFQWTTRFCEKKVKAFKAGHLRSMKVPTRLWRWAVPPVIGDWSVTPVVMFGFSRHL